MLRDLFIAFRGYKEAHRFIRSKQLFMWVLMLGILYSACLGFSFLNGFHLYNQITGHFFEAIHLRQFINRTQDQTPVFFIITGKIFLDLLLTISFFSVIRFFYFLLFSPLLVWVQIRTQHLPSSGGYILQWKKHFSLTVKYFFWLLVYFVSILLFAWIPIIGWLMPLLFFLADGYLFGSYLLELSASDAAAVKYGLLPKHKGLAIGIGIVADSLHLIPVFGWMLAPAYSMLAANITSHQFVKKDPTLA